jgi:hypothetical protein
MTRHMLAWEMSWRSRTASFIAFYAALSVLAGIFAATSDQVQAQTARPLQGTLIVNVPRGWLPSQDYWLYVEGQIVSAPPYGPFANFGREFIRSTNSRGLAFFDANGIAAESQGNYFTYIRPGLLERVFESQKPIQLAPGKYVVELLTRAVNKSFPFAVARIEAQISAGKTKEIWFGISADTEEVPALALAFGRCYNCRCGNCSWVNHPPEETLEYIQNEFNKAVQQYEEDPIVAVLNQVLLNLSVTPSSQRRVFANLPDSMSGGRELDARQVSLIIEDLKMKYEFPSIYENSSLRSAASPIPQLAAHIALKIGEHNTRIVNFRQIVKALEQAKP